MEISCNAVQDLVVLYHEDSLSPATKAEVDAHLKTCKVCSGFYGGFRKMNQQDIPASAPASEKMPDYAVLAKKLKRQRIAHRSLWSVGILTGTLLGWGVSWLIASRKDS